MSTYSISNSSVAGGLSSSQSSASTTQSQPSIPEAHPQQSPTHLSLANDLTVNPRTQSDALASAVRSQWWRRVSRPANMEAVSGLTKWEGRVVELGDGSFTVELRSIDSGVSPDNPLYADFDMRLLEPDKAEVGDIVYVTARFIEMGRRLPPSRTVSVRLRRIGNWSEADVEMIDQAAAIAWTELQDFVD